MGPNIIYPTHVQQVIHGTGRKLTEILMLSNDYIPPIQVHLLRAQSVAVD